MLRQANWMPVSSNERVAKPSVKLSRGNCSTGCQDPQLTTPTVEDYVIFMLQILTSKSENLESQKNWFHNEIYARNDIVWAKEKRKQFLSPREVEPQRLAKKLIIAKILMKPAHKKEISKNAEILKGRNTATFSKLAYHLVQRL